MIYLWGHCPASANVNLMGIEIYDHGTFYQLRQKHKLYAQCDIRERTKTPSTIRRTMMKTYKKQQMLYLFGEIFLNSPPPIFIAQPRSIANFPA